jgi:pantothenate kinase
MATASIEVSGPDAEASARELHANLAAAAGPGDDVSAVEVERSAELVIAVIGLVFAGVSTAKTIWDWWSARRSEGVTVKILLADGASIDLAGVDRERLEIAFEQRAR